jgi:sugar/nucleoside kinase (ribokinase family)
VDVISFGTNYLEMVFGHIGALPGPGEEIFTDQFAISCGGAVAIASAARDVGAEAAMATVLGEDLGTRVVEAHCARTGVDLSCSRRVSGPTSGISCVINFDGDRSFISHLPDEAGRAGDAVWWLDVVRARRPKWIYLHAHPGTLPLILEARRLGCRTAIDTELGAIGRFPGAVVECATAADVFLLNSRELSALTATDDLAGSLEAIGAPPGVTIVVKQGAHGATVARGGRTYHVVAGVRDIEVQDRTGAGDAFAGALLGSLALGADMAGAVAAGNAAGSQAVARLGAIGSVTI